ncbi:MAG: bifunctional lysine ketoglutarate reductase /saccharopine dehydrogenase family protein [bacterium]
MRIGIRREDKNEWERRAPLIPKDVGYLTKKGVEIFLQPSKIRIFPDEAYQHAGAVISEDLSPCPFILAVKEIPLDFLEAGKTYLFFSHTLKGQALNMPLLQKMMELRCQLLDYELVKDEHGRRLIFFGRQAGQAGMIDTFWALGKRTDWEGLRTPFSQIMLAHEYESLVEAKSHLSTIADEIRRDGLPSAMTPLVCGFAGYGNVSQGAQEIFDLFPNQEISPSDLALLNFNALSAHKKLFKSVFREQDLVQPIHPEKPFELQDYYENPQNYRSRFETYLPHLTVLVNCIYWEPRYPRLVTLNYLKRAYSAQQPPKLKVIGDISCDIEGSIQCTVKATDPGNPVYVYQPRDDRIEDSWQGTGPVVMAVDNLPCELAQESSEFFSKVLTPFVPQLAAADYRVQFENLPLPAELKRAMILHQGKLTPAFEYLSEFIENEHP